MANCAECGQKSGFLTPLLNGYCQDCRYKIAEADADKRKQQIDQLRQTEAAEELRLNDRVSSMILTTETCHDLPIDERLGIVASEVVIGMHIFRDLSAALRDVFGGRSGTMQTGLKQLREAALAELKIEAAKLEADAVVGVDLDYSEISGGGKSMLFLVASGTAVRLRK